MRIVHVITRLIVGGAQENTVLTCEGLADLGHDVTLLTGPTTGPEGSLVDRAARGIYHYIELSDLVREISPAQDLHAIIAMARIFAQLGPDIVHTHSSKAGVIGRLAARLAGVPIVIHTIHGMSFNRTQPRRIQTAYKWAERLCAELSDSIVCVADAMAAQSLDAGVGRQEQYVTIRSGMETGQFDPSQYDAAAIRSQWGFASSDVVVGTVARLFENKGYEQLIEVIGIAAQRDPRLKFVWVGDGAHRERYEDELRRRKLRDRVMLTGLIPPANMPRVLAGVDLLAHTSQWEGLPRAVVQALLMGKPAVSFAIDGAPEVIVPGVTGELATLGDTSAFADAILSLAADANRRMAYGQAGRERCLVPFDRRTMVAELAALYDRLLSRG